ncbi:MAG TPA: hypothetical protein VK210_03840 [Terriglobia bacterium]|nr:hypothetical protein [Terriglobia bacterium]
MKKALLLLTLIAVLGTVGIVLRSKPETETVAVPQPVEHAVEPIDSIDQPVPKDLVPFLLKLDFSSDITAANIQEFYATENLALAPGQQTLLVRGKGLVMCSPTGNCPTYLFLKEDAGYRMLCDIGDAQRVLVLGSSTLGYRDVRASMHGSATSSDVSVFRFNGTDYHAEECYAEDYSTLDDDSDGKPQKDPVITPHNCER